jgi:hypothetical protein
MREGNPEELTCPGSFAIESTNATDNAVAAVDARDNVLATPELLEAIISFLPMRDIFANTQRVSRTWNAIVQSPQIQARLWLRSPNDEVASPVGFSANHVWPPGPQPRGRFLKSNYPVYPAKITHNPIFKDPNITRKSLRVGHRAWRNR